MKTGLKSMLLMAVAVPLAFAQQQPPRPTVNAQDIARTNMVERVDAPTESDIYCAGLVSPQPLAKTSIVAGGWETPSQSRFADRDYIYLTGGGYDVDAKYAVMRQVRDINEFEPYQGKKRNLKAAGILYSEVGRVRVIKVDKNVGIAQVEFACEHISVGDFTVPWQEKPAPKFRRTVAFDRFASPNGMAVGRIIAANESRMIAGAKDKIYLNIGADKGLKVGDYFRATRTYESIRNDLNDSLLFKATVPDPEIEKHQLFPARRVGEFPRRAIGEMIILSVTPTTATAMVTRSLEQIQVGDGVEMMEELPPLPPPPAAVMNPPQITCSASPATVRAGENSTIRCEAMSPDNRPVTITFSADRGNVVPRETSALLETANVAPGAAMVMATAMDDRNLSATAVTQVNVEAAPAAAAASQIGDLTFKNNSAYVDNRAKAFLDDVALRLQREAGSQVVLVGHVAAGEAARLAGARAGNAKNYLTKDKGIDASRIQVRDGGAGGRIVNIWFVPAGAALP
ncbi:MAG TPA: OmpA family protein [Terriglobales bacterium]|nr:OmpA family protein [Terriglobales bacterium]